jgi:hypothetical protein
MKWTKNIPYIKAIKIYVAIMKVFKEKERGDETWFTTKIGGKLIWVPIISFNKISFLVKHLMPYYAKTDRSHP